MIIRRSTPMGHPERPCLLVILNLIQDPRLLQACLSLDSWSLPGKTEYSAFPGCRIGVRRDRALRSICLTGQVAPYRKLYFLPEHFVSILM